MDVIAGGPGDDDIWGGNNTDVVAGGPGNDMIWGDNGPTVTSGFEDDDQLEGNDGNDQIWGDDGNDTIWGDDGNDNLFGDAGNDQLFGGDGDDYLLDVRKGDTDLLVGNAGRDTFGCRDDGTDPAQDTIWGGNVGGGGDGHDDRCWSDDEQSDVDANDTEEAPSVTAMPWAPPVIRNQHP